MADETSQDQPPDLDGAATPNRDRRHEPPSSKAKSRESPRSVRRPPPADVERTGAEPPPAANRSPSGEECASRPWPVGAARACRPLIGAIVGAVVAAGGLWFLGQRPAADPTSSSRLDAPGTKPRRLRPPRVAALDKRVGALEAASEQPRPTKASPTPMASASRRWKRRR